MNEVVKYSESQPVSSIQQTTTQMAVTRQAQEVQAAMIVAKNFPRDEVAASNRVMNACRRMGLAQKAIYEYPRGGTSVTGPSIRLAEAMAQAWGNLDFGIIELDQKPGESTVMSYCWDLETNTRQTKIFTVPHIRYSKKGGNQSLTDPRDIYEMVANQGARRLRSCILGIIPKDVIDDAMQECIKTMSGESKEPLIDRIKRMVSVFYNEFGVPQVCLEKYIGCKVEAFTEQSIVRLIGVYNSIKEGRADREEYFDLPKVDQPATDIVSGEQLPNEQNVTEPQQPKGKKASLGDFKGN